MRSLLIALVLLLVPGSACPQPDTKKEDSPLAIGIARNQQELQELSKLISENNAEMRHIAGEVYVSLAAAVAGAGPESEFGQSPREAVAKLLGALQKLEGAIDTSKDALDGDAWLAISGQLKLVLDVIGEEDFRIRFANTFIDLLVKTAQLVALARQNADLVAVKVRIAEAQTYLLAKAASMQLRRTASQAGLLAQIKTFSDLQSRWLLEQYKDRPQVIQLAVKTASAKDASRATQIVKGLQAGDAANAMDLSNIPGINPDAVEAMRRCNAIALTMVCRFENVAAILRTCPKAHNPGDDPPPCPSYERAAAQNAAIDRASMTCNKYSDGSYIPFFGPPRGVAAMWPMPAPTSAVQSGCGQQPSSQAVRGSAIPSKPNNDLKPKKVDVVVHWAGVQRVGFYLYRADGQMVGGGGCDPGGIYKFSVLPGDYTLRQPNSDQFMPLKIAVGETDSEVSATPAVGHVSFSGFIANNSVTRQFGPQKSEYLTLHRKARPVYPDLADQWTWHCAVGSTCTYDVAPGAYIAELQWGDRKTEISINEGQTTVVRP